MRDATDLTDRGEEHSARLGLTSVFAEVRQRLLIGKEEGLILGDDLPPQVLPAGRQLAQLLQLAHPAATQTLYNLQYDKSSPYREVSALKKRLQMPRNPKPILTNVINTLSQLKTISGLSGSSLTE